MVFGLLLAPVMGRKHKVWCGSNWQFSAFCLTTTMRRRQLQSWLPMNFIVIKSKLYNFSLLHGLTSNPRHNTYIYFMSFSDSQCLTVNSRITRNPFQTLNNRELKRRRQLESKTSKTLLKKWIRVASNLILFHLVQFMKCWDFFLELNSKRLYRSSGEEI